MLNTGYEADLGLKQRLLTARAPAQYQTTLLSDEVKPLIRSLIRKGASKKQICTLFHITYGELKQQLAS